MRMLVRILAAACLLFGCAKDELHTLIPRIAVVPEILNFGEGAIDGRQRLPLEIHNRGSGTLVIDDAIVEPVSLDSVFFHEDLPSAVDPLALLQVNVVFVPRRAREIYGASLMIRSNDRETPTLRVPLNGSGGIRDIEVIPSEIDFGLVNEGHPARRAIEIRNVGKDPLEVSSVTWTSTSTDLRLDDETFRLGTIGVSRSTVVDLTYAPGDPFGDVGLVTIRSNDEDEATVVVPVRGQANLAPRAIAWGCNAGALQVGCEGVPRRHAWTGGVGRVIGLEGRESFDPEGSPLVEYRWSVEAAPIASNAAPFHSTDDRQIRMNATGDFEVDLPGRFDLRLIVKDERGVESLDHPDAHISISPKDLEILLRWDLATDVDLHVVSPGGSVGDYGNGLARTSTGTDCSSFNRQPNWVDLLTAEDDPSLDIDAVSSRGPEIVSLDFPEDGRTYRAYAHYCDSRDVNVPVGVAFEVYVRGELAFTAPQDNGQRYVLLPGELWEGLHVTWDASTPWVSILDRSQAPAMPAPDLCFGP